MSDLVWMESRVADGFLMSIDTGVREGWWVVSNFVVGGEQVHLMNTYTNTMNKHDAGFMMKRAVWVGNQAGK